MIVDGGSFDWENGKFLSSHDSDPSYHGLNFWEVFGNFEPFGGVNIAFIIGNKSTLVTRPWRIFKPVQCIPVTSGC